MTEKAEPQKRELDIISEAVVRVSYNPKYKSINGLPVNFAIEVSEQAIEAYKQEIRKKIEALKTKEFEDIHSGNLTSDFSRGFCRGKIRAYEVVLTILGDSK